MSYIGKLFKLVVWVVILGLIAGVGAIFFINPNTFKPEITKKIQAYTGLPLEINGPIEWSIKPEASIHIQQLIVPTSAEDKTPLVEIKDATVFFDLLSLISGNLIINDLSLNNVTLDYSVAKSFLADAKNAGKKFTIQTLKVKNASIKLQDASNNLNWKLQNISINAKNVVVNSGQPMPDINLQGDLINLTNNATYTIDTAIKVDTVKHSISLDPLAITWNGTPLKGSASIDQYNSEPVLNGKIVMDDTDVGEVLKKLDPYFANNEYQVAHDMQMQLDYSYAIKDQVLDMSKFNFQVDKGAISGNMKLGFKQPYQAEFAVTADNLDIAPVALIGSAIFPSIRTFNVVPTDLLQNVVVNGKFSGTQITYGSDFQFDQVHMEIKGTDGIIQFNPVIIGAYGGTHNISLNIDVINKDLPFFQFNDQADKVSIDRWMQLLRQKAVLSGTASMKVSLEASGVDTLGIQQTLTGGINFMVNDGTLYGVDADKLMQFANQTVVKVFSEASSMQKEQAKDNLTNIVVKNSSNWISTQENSPITKFNTFALNAEINLGVSNKSSINMTTNTIELKGNGNFSLVDGTLHFDTTLENKQDPAIDLKTLASFMKKEPLAMSIDGTFAKPVFGPSVQTYVLNVLKLAQTDITNVAISKMVASTPPNAKTEKTATELFLNSLQSLR